MRLSNIISMGKEYVITGTILAIIVAVLLLMGYILIYKKIFHGEKKITKGMLLWIIVFVCYLFVVAGATLLDRGSSWETGKIQPLFYSYKQAWNECDYMDWRNNILNILLFVPLGFLLPWGIKFFRRFWKTYLAGFLLTATIETLQLLLRRGIFELDDIFNNTIGAMIGYGCFALVILLVAMIQRKPKPIKQTLAAQLPLVAVLASFATLFVLYSNQELGNMGLSYISKISQDNLSVDSDVKYSTNSDKLIVYQIKHYSQKETYQKAKQFFETMGDTMDESRTDSYDTTAIYYGTTGNSYWIDYIGGTYRYSDPKTEIAKPAVKKVSDATEDIVRTALKQYGIKLPDGLKFANNADGTYTFTANQIPINGVIYDGEFTCEYYANGKMRDIDDNILECKTYKEFPAMSEEDAFKMIQAGKFRNFDHNGKIQVKLGQVSLRYVVDTKGFYQPVYTFTADLNGKQTKIDIAALK